MDFPFEGIPTVPPRKDMTHMVGWPWLVLEVPDGRTTLVL